ncbi:MAG: hypothetical protein ACO20H_05485 [Bacteriovoracaceae bacterium]
MKKLMIAFLALYSTLAVALEEPKVLPSVPEACFDEEIFCHDWTVLSRRNDDNPHGKRVTRIRFFAKLDSYEFESHHDIVARFKDAPAWMRYTDYTNVVNIYKSVMHNSTVDEQGRIVDIHEAHYDLKGPSIIGGKVSVREQALYTIIDPVPGALVSVMIRHDPNYSAKGVKHKTGEIHLTYDDYDETYGIYIILDIVPEINILPKVGAPYIEAGLVAIFKGMFNLY